MDRNGEAIGGLIAAVMVLSAAWLAHVVSCLSHGEWGFLIAGALIFPIAIIHGFGVLFGIWH